MNPSRSMTASSPPRLRAAVAPRQARGGQAAQPADAGLALRHRHPREDGHAGLELEPAARGQRGVVGERLVGRRRRAGGGAGGAHAPLPLGRPGQPRLARGEGRGRHALEQPAGRGGGGGAVRIPVAGLEHHHVAGGHQRQAEAARSGDALGQERTARRPAHAQPQSARARVPGAGGGGGGGRHAGGEERGGEGRRLDHHVQPGVRGAERARQVEVGVEVPGGEHRAQVGVAAAVERQQQRAGPRVRGRGHLGAEQRDQPGRAGRLVEGDRQVEVVAVGERQRAVAQRGRPLDQCRGRGRAPEQRAVRAHPQGDEGHVRLPRDTRRPYFVSEGVRSTKPCSSSGTWPLRRSARPETSTPWPNASRTPSKAR